MAEMEERVSGFIIRGDWADVVEHGERITVALKELDVDEEPLEEWEEWRPKLDENLEDEMKEKTSEQASIEEGKGEQEGETVSDDLQNAGEKLEETYEKLDDDETDSDDAIDEAQDSIDYAKRAADTAGRQALRKVEDAVYQHVMTQFSPYYFDNELISANISRPSSRFTDDVVYEFEVNINDDDLKQAVGEKLTKWDEDIDRWHSETPKSTESQEQADGVNAPENEAPITSNVSDDEDDGADE